jgi:hypothetical protein
MLTNLTTARRTNAEMGKLNNSMHHTPGSNTNATPPEITASTKLYNVIVENEKVEKELLQNGKLKKHFTIISLNMINVFKMSAQVSFVPFFVNRRS